MGCDIHSYVEQLQPNTETWSFVDWKPIEQYNTGPFDWRSYGVFAFLAGVRNYSEVPVIVEPRGFPKQVSSEVMREIEGWECDLHTPSWLTVQELLNYDYNKKFENLRYA